MGDSGGKVKILGGDSITHCEKSACVYFWVVTELQLFEFTNKKAMVIKKNYSLLIPFQL